MILSIFELDIILDGLKDQYSKDFYTKSGKNKQVLVVLHTGLKELRNIMVDNRLAEWELLSDAERGQKIIRPKYDPGYVDSKDFDLL